MGACMSKDGKEDRDRSARIDRVLEQDAKRLKKESKILLLGAGESGKSTVVKQMKIIHQNGYTVEELLTFRPTIYRNLLESAESVVLAMRKLGIHPSSPENANSDLVARVENWANRMREEGWFGGERGARGALMWLEGELEKEAALTKRGGGGGSIGQPSSLDLTAFIAEETLERSRFSPRVDHANTPNSPLPPPLPSKTIDAFPSEIARAIHNLFCDPSFKLLIEKHLTDFYLMDSGSYFMENALRIGSGANYVPTVTDVLRARAKSVGIAEARFDIGQLCIHMFDVGGQRSERRKWIHCFESVTSIIFCVALSEYDQCLLEAKGTNRLVESLVLFKSIVHSQWFSRTSIVLFLNKMDVFKLKVPKIPLSDHFSEYAGGPDVQKAARFILWKFTQENNNKLSIYPHLTQATDTHKIRLVFAAVKETILSNSLKESGIL